MRGIDRECTSLCIERARRIVEHAHRRACALSEQLDATASLGFIFREDFENADQVFPVAAGLVDAFEDRGDLVGDLGVLQHALERHARTVVRRVELQDLAIVVERTARVVEVLFEHLRQPVLEIDQRGLGLIYLETLSQHIGVRRPIFEPSIETVERLERRCITGVIVEDLAVRFHGFLRLFQLLDVEACR